MFLHFIVILYAQNNISLLMSILRRVVYKLRFVRFPCQPMRIRLFYDKFITKKQFLHSKRRKTKGNDISNQRER